MPEPVFRGVPLVDFRAWHMLWGDRSPRAYGGWRRACSAAVLTLHPSHQGEPPIDYERAVRTLQRARPVEESDYPPVSSGPFGA